MKSVALASLLCLVVAGCTGASPSDASSAALAQHAARAPQIVAGSMHTCALVDGGVKCWGDNSDGELGDGTGNDSAVPVAVEGLGSGVRAIAAGERHTCALTNGGAVKCWGANDAGQLGTGALYAVDRPAAVYGLDAGVIAISAASEHSCALLASGGVQCWGSDHNGQLGDDWDQERTYPGDVNGLASGVAGLAVGESGLFQCAVLASGGVSCWGDNGDGQLGNADGDTSYVPVAVDGLADATAVATGGFHACAIADGTAFCWGKNTFGALGNGTTTGGDSPAHVAGLDGVTAIAAGEYHTCAIASGAAVCWGWNNDGQIGDGTTTSALLPTAVRGIADVVTAIATGDYHSCAITASGAALCWGGNARGALGNGTTTSSPTAVPVAL